MIRKIVRSDDPKLREKSKPVKKVDKKIKALIDDLKDTIRAQHDPEGVGLAASQIGKNVQVFVIKPSHEIKTIINPKVLSTDKEKIKKPTAMEGCLSIPHYYSPLPRAKSIKIEYLDEDGKKQIEEFRDFPAQIVQHEIDHLNGKLFIDHLFKEKKPLYQMNEEGEWEEVDFALTGKEQ